MNFQLSTITLSSSFTIAVSSRERFRSFFQHTPSDQSQKDCSIQDKQHNCSTDPAQIRQEVEALIEVGRSRSFKYFQCNISFVKDFNGRLKNVLYHSHIYAVVCGLLPCCLAQVDVFVLSSN